MGHTVNATCLDCGGTFTVEHGGGFSFHLLRCDKCGRTKSIRFDELGELHLRFLKGLNGPYSVASSEHDEYVCRYEPVEPISESEYYKEIEVFAGECKCGGQYCFDVPPRCPKCRSTRIEEGETTILYD